MITAVHTLVYSTDADATRGFFRDVVGWNFVDDGGGWLIFQTGASEMGVHPTDAAPVHAISLMCDDIEATIAELSAKGAEFTGPPEDHGYGLVTMMKVPHAGLMQLYQPSHKLAYNL